MANYKIKINKISLMMICCPIFWPFINFLNTNVNEYYNRLDLLIYFCISLVLFLILFILFSFLLKKIRTHTESAVIFSICVILFFSYPIVVKIAKFLDHHEDFLKLWIITFISLFLITFVLSKRKWFQDFILIFCICLFVTPIGQTIYLYSKKIFSENNFKTTNFSNFDNSKIKDKYNVFYVIPDQYGRSDVLKKLYDFDNEDFINELRKRNFIISKNSTSNYPRTIFSVSSTFAKNYLFTENKLTKISEANEYIYDSKSPTHLFFRNNNYEIMNLKYSGTDCKIGLAEYCLSYDDIKFSDLELNLLKLTPLEKIISIFSKNLLIPKYFEMDNFIKYINERNFEKPIFSYIHLYLPHEPYRFKSNCEPLPIWSPYWHPINQKKGYIDNTKCANKGLLALFDDVIKKYPKTIFIIQSDHGPALGVDLLNDIKNKKKSWKLSFSILNAWYFPPDLNCKDLVVDNMTSINTFRIIDACLLNKEAELLNNRWFSPLPSNELFTNRMFADSKSIIELK